jgi:PncC family amidohydrolase
MDDTATHAIATDGAAPPGASSRSRPGWLAHALARRQVATAESCTAGRIATLLAKEPGASAFLRGGIVAYEEVIKRDLLRVTAPCIYSEETAIQMADGVCALTGADVAVATTGLAGPEPLDGIAPGTVCIAVRVGSATTARTYRFDGTEDEICAQAAERALVDLAAALSTDLAAIRDPGVVSGAG